MKDQKISTTIGTVILIIISATVGGFVLLCIKKYPVNDVVEPIIIPSKLISNGKIDDAEWKVYTNDPYGFSIQYPSDYYYDESSAVDITKADYYLSLGPSYEKVFGKKHSYRNSAGIFEIWIQKSNSDLKKIIQEADVVRSQTEHTSKAIGNEEVDGFLGAVVKSCDIGGFCSKIVYIMNNQYVYIIDMKEYYSTQDQKKKEVLDRMLDSVTFTKKEN